MKKLPKLFWVCSALFVGVIAVGMFVRHAHPGSGGVEINVPRVKTPPVTEGEVKELQQKRAREIAEKKLIADIELRLEKFNGDLSALVEKYRKMLPLSQADEYFQQSVEGGNFIASKEGLCGFKCCVSLAYKMAYDKIKDTNRTGEAIEPLVKAKISAPIEKAIGVYAKWSEDYKHELQKEAQVFALDIAARGQKFSEEIMVLSEADAKAASAAIDKFVGEVEAHASEAVVAMVGAGVEMALIKTSYETIKKLVIAIATKALESSAARIGTSAAAGAGTAVADGPLPIGDIIGALITVGGLTWTAYDIYKVTKKMPDEMRDQIIGDIRKTQKALLSTAQDNLKNDQDSCRSFAKEQANAIIKALKGNNK